MSLLWWISVSTKNILYEIIQRLHSDLAKVSDVWISNFLCGMKGVAAVIGVLGICHSWIGWFLLALNVYFSRILRPRGESDWSKWVYGKVMTWGSAPCLGFALHKQIQHQISVQYGCSSRENTNSRWMSDVSPSFLGLGLSLAASGDCLPCLIALTTAMGSGAGGQAASPGCWSGAMGKG